MPIPEEIRKVEAGKKVRVPRELWSKLLKGVKKQYPDYGEERINAIAAGIWHKYPKATKLRLLRRYQKERKGNPNGNPEKNGKLYGTLKRAWIGFKIAKAQNDLSKQVLYAGVINKIRAELGQKPIEFRA